MTAASDHTCTLLHPRRFCLALIELLSKMQNVHDYNVRFELYNLAISYITCK